MAAIFERCPRTFIAKELLQSYILTVEALKAIFRLELIIYEDFLDYAYL